MAENEDDEIAVTKGLLCAGETPVAPAKVLTRNGYSMLSVSIDLGQLPPLGAGDWTFLPEN
jgi:hypothetical protein